MTWYIATYRDFPTLRPLLFLALCQNWSLLDCIGLLCLHFAMSFWSEIQKIPPVTRFIVLGTLIESLLVIMRVVPAYAVVWYWCVTRS